MPSTGYIYVCIYIYIYIYIIHIYGIYILGSLVRVFSPRKSRRHGREYLKIPFPLVVSIIQDRCKMLILLVLQLMVAVVAANKNIVIGSTGCNLGSPNVGAFPEFTAVRDGLCVFRGAIELYAQTLVQNNFSLVSTTIEGSCKKLTSISRQVTITDIFGLHFINPDNSSQFIFGINGKNLLGMGLNYPAKISMKLFSSDHQMKAPLYQGRVLLNSSRDLQMIFSIEPKKVNEIIHTYRDYNRIRIKIKNVALKKLVGCNIYEFNPMHEYFLVSQQKQDNLYKNESNAVHEYFPEPQPDNSNNSNMFTELKRVNTPEGTLATVQSTRIISSANGQRLYSININNGYNSMSSSADGGASWSFFSAQGYNHLRDIACSSNGRVVVVIANTNPNNPMDSNSQRSFILISNNYGVDFAVTSFVPAPMSDYEWKSLAMSVTGDKIFVAGFRGSNPVIVESFNYGSTFAESFSFQLGSYSWYSDRPMNISCSDNCDVIIANDPGIVQFENRNNNDKHNMPLPPNLPTHTHTHIYIYIYIYIHIHACYNKTYCKHG